MARRPCSKRELLDRWRGIQEEQEEDEDPSPSKERRILQAKEEWFSDSFLFLVSLPNENHIWCSCPDLMGPLLETFHNYFEDKHSDSPLKLAWKRISQELGQCIQCICQHHQAQDAYISEYEADTVVPLLKVLQHLDGKRVTEHLKGLNARILRGEYDIESQSAEVVSLMFEVLTFPILFNDQSLVDEFQVFIEAIDNNHEVTLAGSQQYPGIYALLFLRSGRARAIGLRLAGCMAKLRRAPDLEPLQPLLMKYMGILETEALPSTLDATRPRVQNDRLSVWLGIKTLLGFLEPPAFEEGILERYPIFLSIVLNHVSDDTPEFSYAVTCLRASFEMLGCKLWLRTSLSPSMMRNTLLGQCFHTRNEKSHKEIFDLFLPFLQSLEALQDGEHEKQRRHFLYFLLHQVTQSSNFSFLMRKNARKIALLIIHRGYKMNPPSPPSECAHMWGPSLVASLKDSSLHNSLRQPAFNLIQTIIVSDTAALIHLKYLATSNVDLATSTEFIDDEDELPFSHDVEDKDDSIWNEFNMQAKLTSCECKEWTCIPMLWFDVLAEVDPSMLPMSFSKAVLWALSHISIAEPDSSIESSSSVSDWLSTYAGVISSSLHWEIPSGSDDGGDGKGSRNSVKVSSLCIPLLRTLQRLAAHFIIQFEQRELLKQWTWEPRMAESLVLLLLNPNDRMRKGARVILEHVSKTRGLTPGFQFLCSSASSMSAIYFGLKYAIRQVQVDSILPNFHNVQHLFFIIRKLLNEVVGSPQKPPGNPPGDLKCEKFSFEGGFLRQPSFDNIPASSSEYPPIVVDMRSWENFSFLLSTITWPFILKCLVEGKELINSKNCQMGCVRLLETLPVVFERLRLSASKLSGSSASMVPGVFDYKWLWELVDWGKSSLAITTRHWKQCMHSLLNFFKGSCNGEISCEIGVIQAIILQETIAVDRLVEKVIHLSFSLSKEAPCIGDGMISKAKPVFSECFIDRTSLNSKTGLYEDKSPCAGGKPMLRTNNEEIIVLSDEETEKLSSPVSAISSCSRSRQRMPDEALFPGAGKGSLSDDHMVSSRGTLKPFESRIKESQYPSGEQVNDIIFNKRLFSVVESSADVNITSLSDVEGVNTKKGVTNLNKASGTVTSSKEGSSIHKELQSQSVYCQSSAQTVSSVSSKTNMELEEASGIKEIICDYEIEPLEHALDHSVRPLPVLTKLNVSASKRKVIQLQMPSNNKSGSLNKMGPSIRRLKPPRLDDWYRPILEIDYFAVVGLSSTSAEKNTVSTNLKEVPLYFQSSDHYVDIFRPLILEEFKAQLHNSFIEMSSDEICCGSLSIISVERIDDFHIVRGCPDEIESSASRGCSENDLVLLTKEPLQNSVQHIHVLGKVERRERSDKKRSTILVIRVYLLNGSSRLNKVKRLLIERSKWSISRVMSITPQLREFQALSSLHDIPMLPIILNPLDPTHGYMESRKAELSKLGQPMQKMLKSSFNDSQLKAISAAIRTHYPKRTFELSLIQGPPGTGKTRTIVAIVTALQALHSMDSNCNSKTLSSMSMATTSAYTNLRPKISQSTAIARAWQDAALAKQMLKNADNNSSGSTEHLAGGRVLICAQSNAAVDELVSRISEGLYGNDGKIYKPYLVRVGNAKTVHPSSLPFFMDTLVEERLAADMMNQSDAKNDSTVDSSSSLRARLEKLLDNIRYYESKRAELSDMNLKDSPERVSLREDDLQELSDSAIGAKLNILYGQKRAICGELAAAQSRERKASEESRSVKNKIRKSILREAEIVVATLSGCGGDLYGVCSESASGNRFGTFSEQALFDVVIIDEAAQALEPATLIPLQLLKSNRTKCIMVGDPKQLPATVLSNIASKFLYECSMFERLQRAGHPVVMLTEQYRMHPEISTFPSLHFYENKLLNGAQMANKSAPFHENVYLGPYVFFDIIDGHEHHGKNSSGSLSLCNESEVEAAVAILKFLKKRYPSEFSSGKMGIITPYRSQLSLLRSRFSNAFGPIVTSDIEFNTVDGFQGREVDILMLSTVRASDSSGRSPVINSNSIGFVADVRRMNVALTRARFSLWIVGNAKTLEKNIHWASLIQNAKERNLFISVARPYESIFKKDSSSSRGNYSFPRLGSHSSHRKECEKVKDAASGAQSSRNSAKEASKKNIRIIKTKSDALTSRDVDARGNRDLQKSGQGSQHDQKRLKEMDPPVRKPVGNCTDEAKESRKERNNSASVGDTVKTNTTCNRVGNRAIQPGIQLKANDDIKNLMKKAKGIQKISEHTKSINPSQKRSSTLPSSVDESQKIEEASNLKPTKVDDTAKDVIASRKRQREDVDALLSSALISSKKPESSSKLAPVKRPFPAAASRGSINPSKLSKGSANSKG